MRISESMIRYYLDTVTVGYFDEHDLPADDVRGYDDYIRTLKQKAVKHHDMDALRVALAYLLSSEGLDLAAFNGGRYPFDDAEMREIVRHAYEVLFAADEGLPETDLSSVELVQMPVEEWWRERPG
ncbi:hypothetical protein [Polyangium aurulentum]|uniref:hypothetical protein n=1 Tax=Polyangium aurulentum TaxID=2567896 RepID=UPI0010ADDAE3|nr:hypothetical protein [Polyangium aurulentum]UQA61368.1 hypothetical protein E8A73_013190 [Polyangium aurulentum]